MRRSVIVAAAASMTWLAACSAPAAPTPVKNNVELRVLVKLAQPSADTAAIVAQVTLAAGAPARYIAATSMQWHALALECVDANACEAAMQRLGSNPVFEVVQRDERKRIVTP